MYEGYLLDWRKEVFSAIWLKPPLYYKVWKYILKRANYEDKILPLSQGGTLALKRGQFLTTLRDIADGISWYERNRKTVPHPNQIRRILRWMEGQGMIVTEKVNLTCASHQPNKQAGFRNNPPTLITILNYSGYQLRSEGGRNRGRDSSVTREVIKKNKKISCGKLEDLKGLLISLPEFVELPKETQGLITAFLDKARLDNKSHTITGGRVQKALTGLIAISGETSLECLNAALEITLHKAETGQFTFSKQNVTGYVKAIAKSQYQQVEKAMFEKYEPHITDTEALYS
ncbi:MAG: hypothetical protein ACYSRZ_09670 [Planctomycetota bacterium]|jgi:hypothetical protein